MYGLGVNKLGASRSILGNAIANLFSNGEQGAWYDPSDISTMFQESSLVTPAVIGEPVGTIFDKSQSLKRGSELVINGDFSTDTNWNKGDPGWSIANGSAIGTGVSGRNLSQTNISFTEDAIYNLQFTVTRTAGNIIPRLGGTTSVNGATIFQSGTYNIFLRANSSSNAVVFRGNAGFTGTIDNVSVKRVLGNHAYQDTSIRRPVLARHPEGGIRNLLDYTQEFNDWVKGTNTTVTDDYATSPDNTQTADRLQLGTQSETFIRQRVDVISGEPYTFSVYVKATSGTSEFDMFSDASGTQLGKQTATSEWQRFTFTATSTLTGLHAFGINNGSDTYSSDILMWGAQVELGSTATQYQHVTDDLRYDITEPLGASSLNYLSFNGANDCLATSDIDFTATDSMSVFAGARKKADEVAIIAELSGNIGNNNGAFRLASIAGDIWRYSSKGTSVANSNATGYVDPVTSVLTGLSDISDSNTTIRVDGVEKATAGAPQGSGNYGNLPLNIGSRNNGSGLTLDGNIYGLVIRGSASTDKEIESTESYMAKKTGVLSETAGLATLSLNFDGNSYTARNRNGGIL